MLKRLQFLILFFILSISTVFAGYVNTYSIIYSSTTETSDVVLKGDMWVSSNAITGVPSESRVEFHSTGDDALILNDGDLYISTGSNLKFSDGSLQNTAGVGSAGNVSNNSDSIIVADADNNSAGDILFKIYNSTYVSISNAGITEIKGRADASSVSAGYIGETIEYESTSLVTGTTTIGAFTDALSGCTLTAGKWLINASANILITGASGTGAEWVSIQFAITDNSNTILKNSRTGIGNTANPSVITHPCLTLVVNISASTTYKLRFSTVANSGTPTITGLEALGTATIPIKFIATRIA